MLQLKTRVDSADWHDMTELTLGFGLTFTDLYEHAGLETLDLQFIGWLREADSAPAGNLADRLLAARAPGSLTSPLAGDGGESSLLIDLAPHLDDFVGELFGIGGALRQLAARHEALNRVQFEIRRFLVRSSSSERLWKVGTTGF